MNADPKLKPDIAALKKRLSEDPGFAAQVTGEQAAMRPELALFFRDLRNHLLHVIDMSKGEHYLDVVRLNAQALIRRIELLSAAPATVAMDAQAGVEDLRREVARLKVENARLAEETMRLQGLLTAAHQIVGELARPSGI